MTYIAWGTQTAGDFIVNYLNWLFSDNKKEILQSISELDQNSFKKDY